jgi:hypothetical protein
MASRILEDSADFMRFEFDLTWTLTGHTPINLPSVVTCEKSARGNPAAKPWEMIKLDLWAEGTRHDCPQAGSEPLYRAIYDELENSLDQAQLDTEWANAT